MPSSGAEQAIQVRRSQTLVSICHAEIERLILDAELVMGSRVNELALASRLGVSRGPVREACRSLVQAGLLETHANRGFFVRKITDKEVADLYDVRAALMRLAGALVAERATPEHVKALSALVSSMEEACSHGDTVRFQNLNTEFHAALVTIADNRRLEEIYRGLENETRLFRRRGLVSESAMALSNQEHRNIVEAVVSRDPVRTGAVMETHILEGKTRFLSATADELHQ